MKSRDEIARAAYSALARARELAEDAEGIAEGCGVLGDELSWNYADDAACAAEKLAEALYELSRTIQM